MVPVSMIWPLKVSRSTMAAQRRWLAKVLVQPPKASLEAIATEFFSSPSEASGSRRACRADSIPGRGRRATGSALRGTRSGADPRPLSWTTLVGRVALEMFRLRLVEYPDRLMALRVVERECR